MMQGVKCGVSSVYKHMQISVEILELALVLGDLGADRCISFIFQGFCFVARLLEVCCLGQDCWQDCITVALFYVL